MTAPAVGASSESLGFRELVFSDMARYRADANPSWLKVAARCLTIPGMIASVIVRAQQVLHRSGRTLPANLLRTLGNVLLGADFGPGMVIGTGLMLPHPAGVTIGFGLRIGDNVTLAGGATAAARYYEDGHGDQEFATIGDDVVVGAHAVLVGGVVIGDGAMIGANSTVLKDVAPRAVVLGNPARQVGTRDES
ncbi:serine O-acetyltransferase [Jatrophihabitans fulvus]